MGAATKQNAAPATPAPPSPLYEVIQGSLTLWDGEKRHVAALGDVVELSDEDATNMLAHRVVRLVK